MGIQGWAPWQRERESGCGGVRMGGFVGRGALGFRFEGRGMRATCPSVSVQPSGSREVGEAQCPRGWTVWAVRLAGLPLERKERERDLAHSPNFNWK